MYVLDKLLLSRGYYSLFLFFFFFEAFFHVFFFFLEKKESQEFSFTGLLSQVPFYGIGMRRMKGWQKCASWRRDREKAELEWERLCVIGDFLPFRIGKDFFSHGERGKLEKKKRKEKKRARNMGQTKRGALGRTMVINNNNKKKKKEASSRQKNLGSDVQENLLGNLEKKKEYTRHQAPLLNPCHSPPRATALFFLTLLGRELFSAQGNPICHRA